MDFDFSDDQLQLREAVRRWVDKAYGFERRRAIVAAGGLDQAAYRELAALGLCGLYVPEAQGGLGLGPVEAMVAMEELGRGLVLEPLGHTLLAAVVLQGYADTALQADWLPRMASGDALVVLGHLERGLRHTLGALHTHASADRSGWTLSGGKSVVPGGDRADACLVPAQTDQGLALFLVTRGAPGSQTTGYLTQDGSRAGEWRFDGTPAHLITRDGATALAHAVDIGMAASSAYAIGTMERTLSLTADYLRTRQQFGVPIASFQVLRHRMADMKMQLELARGMSYYAHLKLGTPMAERRQALARTQVQLGQSLRWIGQQAVQMHGGIGVTDEYIVSHCFKTLTQLEMTWGDTLHHLGEVSARMQDSAGVFA
jgi:alkylation response protein AidB-like acyl-CoA dehydrogenase